MWDNKAEGAAGCLGIGRRQLCRCRLHPCAWLLVLGPVSVVLGTYKTMTLVTKGAGQAAVGAPHQISRAGAHILLDNVQFLRCLLPTLPPFLQQQLQALLLCTGLLGSRFLALDCLSQVAAEFFQALFLLLDALAQQILLRMPLL